LKFVINKPENRYKQAIREMSMNYNFGNEIGRGGFGIVYSATGSDGNEYALKKLNPSAYPPN